VPQPLIIEEVTISPAPAPQPLARKTCLSCIFYDRQSQRCLLLRRPVADPGRPIC